MATTSRDFEFLVHGTGVPNSNCGEYPNIKIWFTITFNRDPGSPNVSWLVSNMRWNSGEQGNSRYDYPIHIYILVNGSDFHPIFTKEWTHNNRDWESKVTLGNPGQTFESRLTTTNVAIYAKSSPNDLGCYHDGSIPCYTGTIDRDNVNYTCLYDVGGVETPTYIENYTITYRANGGTASSVPSPTAKDNTGSVTLSTQIPQYPLSITYHFDTSVTDTIYRQFKHWNTSPVNSGTTYLPGGVYSENASADLYAIWGAATFTTRNVPDSSFRVTYNYKGGSGPVQHVDLARTKRGFSTSSSSTTVNYLGGKSYTTSYSLNLYPLYNNPKLLYSNLPKPNPRTCYTFDGWYYNGSKITSDITLNGNITLEAHWTPTPIHKVNNRGRWEDYGPQVWVYTNSGWQKQKYIRIYDGSNWPEVK